MVSQGMLLRERRNWVLVFAAFVTMIGMHAYFRTVIIPAQEADAAVHNKPRGNLSDLYPRWLGARELLLHHRDPYSAEVTADIQKGVWGRTLDPKNPNDPQDEMRFAYPLYVVLLLAPTVTLQFESVQRLYFAIAVALSVASVWLWLRTFGHRGLFPQIPAAAMLFLGSYPVVQALFLQQPALVIAGLIAAAFALTANGMFWSAGILLGLTMIKPQSAVPIVGWLLFWALSRWRARKMLFISFVTTVAVMCAGAELLLPGWIWKWREAASSYIGYTAGVPAHVQVIFGNYPGAAVGFVLVLAVGLFCWKTRGDSASSDRFKLAPALILVVNMAVTPIWHEYDHLFLLPAVLLIFHWRNQFHRMNAFACAIVSLSAIVFAWQWIGALTLTLIAFISPELARSLQILPWLPVFFSPTLVLLSLTLIARAQLSQRFDDGRLEAAIVSSPPSSSTSYGD